MGFFIAMQNTFLPYCINKNMENIYDDELMPENFEEIAKAYSQSLKKKGFVFVIRNFACKSDCARGSAQIRRAG